MKSFRTILPLLAVSFFMSGCYTQLQSLDVLDGRDGYNRQSEYYAWNDNESAQEGDNWYEREQTAKEYIPVEEEEVYENLDLYYKDYEKEQWYSENNLTDVYWSGYDDGYDDARDDYTSKYYSYRYLNYHPRRHHFSAFAYSRHYQLRNMFEFSFANFSYHAVTDPFYWSTPWYNPYYDNYGYYGYYGNYFIINNYHGNYTSRYTKKRDYRVRSNGLTNANNTRNRANSSTLRSRNDSGSSTYSKGSRTTGTSNVTRTRTSTTTGRSSGSSTVGKSRSSSSSSSSTKRSTGRTGTKVNTDNSSKRSSGTVSRTNTNRSSGTTTRTTTTRRSTPVTRTTTSPTRSTTKSTSTKRSGTTRSTVKRSSTPSSTSRSTVKRSSSSPTSKKKSSSTKKRN